MTNIPDGYMQDSLGRLVPLDMVKDVDKMRDDLVRDIMAKAKELRNAMEQFKARAMGDVQAFVELSAEKFGANLGGKKGNVTLTSYDGSQKVQVALNETLHFDERITAAKALIDECLMEWASDSRPEIKTLIQDAFQVDREGRINTRRILELRKLDIDDERWNRAMRAISESLRVASSKYYLRLYERAGDGKHIQISLDIASV